MRDTRATDSRPAAVNVMVSAPGDGALCSGIEARPANPDEHLASVGTRSPINLELLTKDKRNRMGIQARPGNEAFGSCPTVVWRIDLGT